MVNTEITEVNLSAFVSASAYLHKALHWALYHVWFKNKSELYDGKKL